MHNYDRRIASQPYECLYGVTLRKPAKRGRDAGVDILASLHPTKEAPTEAKKQNGFPAVFYVYPDGFFKQIQDACGNITRILDGFLKPLGATLYVAGNTDYVYFERAARHPITAWDRDRLNFFLPRIKLPAGPAQKKNAEVIVKECERLSSEFSHLMAVHVQVEQH